ncbi:PHO13 4-nitrophenylphosphatase [Candida maltosa Xu316]|uniref:4-nitrophenylphosphatase n=1 Tax=Candida maltosa (strain Xu316) TaxID=1245528 RepID=M3JZL5_CANMX|nr:4-nitrophenylphosphatase, putative [Candida maltosa Xu316]
MTIKANPTFISTKDTADHILSKYDNFLFDCDGVIWLDEDLIPGVAEFIEWLKKNNKKFAFVTNNSSKSRNTYISKFEKLGIPGITKEMIYPTCYSASLELKRLNIPLGSKIWVLGDEGIEQEVLEMGYVPVGGNDPLLDKEWNINNPILQIDPQVKAVVVGSTKLFNYNRIASTLQYLLHDNKSIPFIGCNIDRTYPAGNGLILPAGGSVVNYMSYTAHRDFIDVGKPSKQFLDIILEDQGFDKSKTLMVGDTMYTDIKFGNDGLDGNSLLVLSGGTKFPDLEHLLQNPHEYENPESMIPTFVAESLGTFIDLIG